MLLEPKNPYQTWVSWGKFFTCAWLGSAWSRLVFVRTDQKKQLLEMGSSKTGSKGCWLLVNERVHRGFSSSLLLTFCMLQCLFVTVSQCLCLRVLLCMCECEYAGGLACSKSRLSEVGEAVAGTIYILVWHRILYFLLCCQHQHPRLFHTGIWGGYGLYHGKRFT